MLPIVNVRLPQALRGLKNGQLPDEVLHPIRPNGRLFVTAATSWQWMKKAARMEANLILKPTSAFDAYRPLTVQTAVFHQRYVSERIPGASTRVCNGKTYWLKPGNAPLACPGTSNHGWGLAVDVANVTKALPWLLERAPAFGWSWELQSEPWHIRYVLGDELPKVAA